MLGMKNYSQDYIKKAERGLDADLSAYGKQARKDPSFFDHWRSDPEKKFSRPK